MLCGDCIRFSAVLVRRTGRPLLRGAWETRRARPEKCIRCGAPIPDADAVEPMRETRSRLSRFGLIGGGRQLLGGRRSS